MAKNPTPSLLDPGQIIKRAFDDDNDAIRVDANVVANISGAQEVLISDSDDSIKIGDGNGNYVGVTNGALNVNSNTTITGTINTQEAGLNSFQTSQYTVGTSVVQLTPSPLANRSSISLRVIATTGSSVFIGNNSGLTISNGYPLNDGDTLQMDLTTSNSIYAVATSPGQTVYVLEIA